MRSLERPHHSLFCLVILKGSGIELKKRWVVNGQITTTVFIVTLNLTGFVLRLLFLTQYDQQQKILYLLVSGDGANDFRIMRGFPIDKAEQLIAAIDYMVSNIGRSATIKHFQDEVAQLSAIKDPTPRQIKQNILSKTCLDFIKKESEKIN